MNAKELKHLLQDVPDDYELRLEFIVGYDADDCAEWNNTALQVSIEHEFKEVFFSPKN